MKNSKITESSKLATNVQHQLINGLNSKYSVKNRGIKKAPFIVLIGAQMPAILMEIAFISNKEEEKKLRTNRYQNDLARQIVKGINRYAADLNGS